jgi:hypothetical protein
VIPGGLETDSRLSAFDEIDGYRRLKFSAAELPTMRQTFDPSSCR